MKSIKRNKKQNEEEEELLHVLITLRKKRQASLQKEREKTWVHNNTKTEGREAGSTMRKALRGKRRGGGSPGDGKNTGAQSHRA